MTVPDLTAVGNHLWQSTAFVLAAWVLTIALRKNSARVRHAIWFAASVQFLVPVSWLFALGSRIHWRSVAVARPGFSVAVDQVSQPFSAVTSLRTVPHAVNPLPIVLFVVWAVGALGIAVAWMVRYRRILVCARSASVLPLDLPVRALSSSASMEPGIFGIFRPVLLLPAGIFDRLTESQLSAVIEHELCHVRHRDNLVASIQMFVETVFWFYPLVWWIGKRMVAERELACDEEVVRRGNARRSYAEGILRVCRLYAESPLVCTSGVTGADLKKRIRAIVAGRVPLEMTVGRRALVVGACLVAVAVPLIVGVVHAADPALAFEAVSIKPIAGVLYPGVWALPSGSRLSIEAMTVGNLITWAYDLKDYQVIGGPAWTGSAQRYDAAIRYNIQAKADGDGTPTRAQFNEMLKAMLADRFQLIMHHEQKTMPVYTLMVDKGGPKFKEAGPDSTHGMTMGGPRCCSTKLEADGVGMGLLAGQFNNTNGSDRPVVDKTGLTGLYTFTLEWEIPQAGRDMTLPSIFTAMKDQLGLKLEPSTAPVDILVIDRVEKPSEN